MAKIELADQVARNQSALEALTNHQQQRSEQERLIAEEQKKQERIKKSWNAVRSFTRAEGQTEDQFIQGWADLFICLGSTLRELGWQSRLDVIQTAKPLERLAICIFQSALLQEKDEVVRLIAKGFGTAKNHDRNKLNELLRRRVMEHLSDPTRQPFGQRYANCEDDTCPACGVEVSPLTYEACQFCKYEIIRRRRLPLDPITSLKVELLKARALADVSHNNGRFNFAPLAEQPELPSLYPSYVRDLWVAMEKFSSLHLVKTNHRKAIPQQPSITTTADYSNAVSLAENWIQEIANLFPDSSESADEKGTLSLIDFKEVLEHLEHEMSRCEQILSHPRYNGADAIEERKWVQSGDTGLMTIFWAEVQKDYRSLPSRYVHDAPPVPTLGMTYDQTIPEIRLHMAWFEQFRQAHPELDLQSRQSSKPVVFQQAVRTSNTKTVRTKRKAAIDLSTDKYDAISSALIEWHKYMDGSVGNSLPKKLNDLAREGIASKGTLSNFFRDKFKGYRAYASMCRRNDGALLFSLKLLNGDVTPHSILDPKTLS